MDSTRRERYRDKLDHAARRLHQVEAWEPDARASEAHRLGRYKAFQEAAEAATDLAAMVLADLGLPVKDDYRNLESLAAAGVLAADLVKPLSAAVGLRNRLVHEYNGLDEALAGQAMARLGGPLRAYLEQVERWSASTK